MKRDEPVPPKDKIFKDPIYGYVSIPRDYMGIIDSPSFQRLRRVSQTSYSPLYSSALHNRFVHSMGVFHLATIAMDTIQNDSKQLFLTEFGDEENWEFDFFKVFELASLLHDVGHSPFSHTGEKFFLNGDEHTGYSIIHEELKALVDDENFSKDVDALEANYANPHEIMSAIVGLKQFSGHIGGSKACSFFARCITGYQYGNSDRTRAINAKEELLNCLISLLNSKVIDVDKLDYLIRDAYIIGYDTVKLDYERLLKALTIVTNDDDEYELAFNKGAVSVIENVIYARDAEKKWIQGHPVVLYENYIVQEIIQAFIKEYGEKAFSSESLSPDGVKCGDTYIRLLCDDDIVSFAKYKVDNPLANQFFDRSKRMHAVWKSEAEYQAKMMRVLSKDGKKDFSKALSKAIRTNKEEKIVIIDEHYQQMLEQLRTADEKIKDDSEGIDKRSRLKHYALQKKMTDCLLNYAKEKEMTRKFIIMPADCFSSGFDNIEFTTLKIKFDENHCFNINEVVSTLLPKPKEDSQPLYYIFYSRINEEKCEDLCGKLGECFNAKN